MSLPANYQHEINALNREVSKAQPTDILQFCANFFNKRLESQRAEFLLAGSSSGSSLTAFADRMSAARSPSPGRSTFPGRVSDGVAPNDGSIEEEVEDDFDVGQSPTATTFRNTLGGTSSGAPRFTNSLGTSTNDTGRSSAQRAAPQSASSGTGMNFSSGGFGQRAQLGGNQDFPSSYNMGRRTSVSAESLQPSTSSDDFTAPYFPKTDQQNDRLRAAVAKNFLFAHLDEEQTHQVLGALSEKPIPAAATRVITQGDAGDFYYIVEKGQFDIYVNKSGSMQAGPSGMGDKVVTVGPGEGFGELALMYNAPRAATVVSTTANSILWSLDRVTFRRILMENTFKRRRMYEAFLEEVPILSSLMPYERSKIADALETVSYPVGSTIIKEGDPGDNFYIIESGEADVVKRGVSQPVNKLKKGDYFGELALLNDAPRAASVVSTSKMKIASLGKDGFQRLLGPVAEIMRRNDPRGASMDSGDGVAPDVVSV